MHLYLLLNESFVSCCASAYVPHFEIHSNAQPSLDVLLRHCNALFMKHVLPRLVSPQKPFLYDGAAARMMGLRGRNGALLTKASPRECCS